VRWGRELALGQVQLVSRIAVSCSVRWGRGWPLGQVQLVSRIAVSCSVRWSRELALGQVQLVSRIAVSCSGSATEIGEGRRSGLRSGRVGSRTPNHLSMYSPKSSE
jgi:hypothetical protein